MKIGLIGYGKMGKAIESIALERGHEIKFRATSSNPLTENMLESIDIAIEFTQPDLAIDHIELALKNKIPLVVGTTGWNNELNKVTSWVENTNGSLIHASNFSIGVNIFFEINARLAQLMNNYPEYQACVEEIHHTQKLDSPSGTAISLANGILDNNESYLSWVCNEGNPPHVNRNQLGVTAYRLPDVPGTHTVTYESEIDTIKMTHQAHNRKGFALGAVIAAEWLIHQKGIFTMQDVLKTNTL